MNKHPLPVFLLSLILILSACQQSQSSMNMPASSASADSESSSEIARLSSLAVKELLSESDFEKLEKIVHDDHDAEHELEEIKTLVKYREFEHAAHGLSFLDAYLKTGNDMLCPGHELMHYYTFTKHGEEEIAEHAIEKAEDQMEEWIPKAREYNGKYPNGEDFDKIVNSLNMHIQNIKSGKTEITDEEFEYLESKASICVEG